MVPITQKANQSACGALEKILADKVRTGNVYLQIYVTYPAGRDYPTTLRYVAYEMNGTQAKTKFMDDIIEILDIWN